MKQSLDMRQGTSLVMTPQLQQAIKLLQLSNQELSEFVEAEIERNRLLNKAEENAEDGGGEQGDAPGLSKRAVSEYWRLYLGGAETTDDPYAAPLVGRDFAGLPPALIHTAELDPLHDDGKVYAENLSAAGTSTSYRCANRMIHGFTRARFEGPSVAREFEFICNFLRLHLDA